MPVLQQLAPIRPPSITPRAVACGVHDSVLDMVDLAEAHIPERAKINYLLPLDAIEVSHHNGQEISAVHVLLSDSGTQLGDAIDHLSKAIKHESA